ncbi:hypothetical protein WR25_25801 [Diploscapter pachys]|uniref:Uncharacterized protein n=1 Tax=Diploscapter pachys TaxID=2018661 RepID=A0A2A2KKD6_9BILA|nr:hypothetical protein WR25_25801 [Diploscapter pachys]
MKSERKSDGTRRFTRKECLSSAKIKAWFSFRARKQKELQDGQTSRARRSTMTEQTILKAMEEELEELEGDFIVTMETENYYDDAEETLEEMISKNRDKIFKDVED